jgi:hypothetical protein
MGGFRGQLHEFGALYASTYPTAYRVAFGVVGDQALDEDPTAEMGVLPE